jgi:uncharacterized RDD family membrane protein YckC
VYTPAIPLDTFHSVETPENIDLHADLAGPVPRVLAYSIDICIRLVVLAILGAISLPFGRAGAGMWMVLSFLLEWFYPVFFEVLRNGQTPGKKMLGLAVVHDDLTAMRWGTAMVRNLLRVADFLPFAYLGGLICMSSNRRFQRFGDLAAGTIVVHRRPAATSTTATTLPDCHPHTPPFALALEDQIAVINFAQRQTQLSQARQEELATILAPTLLAPTAQNNSANKNPAEAVRFWRGVGAWLLGAR